MVVFLCHQIDDYSMVRFLPFDRSDEEGINIVLQNIDFSIQYGEDLEFKEPKVWYSAKWRDLMCSYVGAWPVAFIGKSSSAIKLKVQIFK